MYYRCANQGQWQYLVRCVTQLSALHQHFSCFSIYIITYIYTKLLSTWNVPVAIWTVKVCIQIITLSNIHIATVVIVGLTQLEYVVTEGETVTVCAQLQSGQLERDATIFFATSSELGMYAHITQHCNITHLLFIFRNPVCNV